MKKLLGILSIVVIVMTSCGTSNTKENKPASKKYGYRLVRFEDGCQYYVGGTFGGMHKGSCDNSIHPHNK